MAHEKERAELRRTFKKEFGINWKNSQDEPDIDYVRWLEDNVLSTLLEEKEESRWIKTSDKLPLRDDRKSYSQVPCLCVKRYEYKRGESVNTYYQVQILQFNHEHECWDQEDGDDFDCSIDKVIYWMPIPECPQLLEFNPSK